MKTNIRSLHLGFATIAILAGSFLAASGERVGYEAQARDLREVFAEATPAGSYRLVEGFRGSLAVICEAPPSEAEQPRVFEYSAVVKSKPDEGAPNHTRIELLEAFQPEEGSVACWDFVAFCPALPSAAEICAFASVDDYVRVFGRDGWSSNFSWGGVKDPVSRTTFSSAGFELIESGKVRVITVYLELKRADGAPWQIEKKRIREGYFAPTGAPPVFRTRNW